MGKQWKEVSALSRKELDAKLQELEASLFKMKMQHSLGQLSNTAGLSATRAQIARVKFAQSRVAN